MDEHEGLARSTGEPGSALQAVHGAGLLAAIALLVAACGFGLLAFLGEPQSVAAGPVHRESAAGLQANGLQANGLQANGLSANGLSANGLTANGLTANGLPAPVLPSPDADQQAAFLEAVRLSGTGGWSSRLDVLEHGVRACRLLADGQVAADVVSTLVAAGEQRAQARAVTVAAPRTLCPSAVS